MDEISLYFVVHPETKEFLCYVQKYGKEAEKYPHGMMTLLHPVDDRNEILSLCHSTDHDRGVEWLRMLVQDCDSVIRHCELDPALTKEELEKLQVVKYSHTLK